MGDKGLPAAQVTAVVVTYNSARVVGDCLRALRGLAEVIVVDNASADDSIAVARAALPGARIVANPENRGLGCAVNQGFAEMRTPYGLYLNPDAVLAEGALERLVAQAGAHPGMALIAPLLVKTDGEQELYLRGPHELRHFREPVRPDGAFCTWFTMCSVFLFRVDVWRRLGGFDENIFLFSEDFDLCVRTTAGGFGILVDPAAVARHLSGQSAPPTTAVRLLKDWHMTWSHFYVQAKHGDAGRTRAEARRVLLRHGMKTLLYVLLARPGKVRGNFAKAHAALTFLRGRTAAAGPRGGR